MNPNQTHIEYWIYWIQKMLYQMPHHHQCTFTHFIDLMSRVMHIDWHSEHSMRLILINGHWTLDIGHTTKGNNFRLKFEVLYILCGLHSKMLLDILKSNEFHCNHIILDENILLMAICLNISVHDWPIKISFSNCSKYNRNMQQAGEQWICVN